MNTASKITVQALISVVAAGALLQAETDSARRAAASLVSATAPANRMAPAIIWSPGVMKINGATHNGSGNVLPGNRVEMLRSSGQMYFADGTRLRMGADTSLTLSNNAVLMESGVARIDAVASASRPLHVKAGDLDVSAGAGTISRPAADQLVLTAANVPMSVTNGAGLLVATVNPGQTMSFQTVAFAMGKGSASPKDGQLTGVVSADSKKYYISDEATNVKYQILGGHPKPWTGKRVKISGEIGKDSAGLPTIRLDDDKAIAALVGGAGAAGAAAGAASGVSTAVIAGVVVTGAAIAGTTVALVNRESDTPISVR